MADVVVVGLGAFGSAAPGADRDRADAAAEKLREQGDDPTAC
ncbi:hypothetical protein JOF29_008673 [Kribbella aluminosa]|uniref:Uncharacterized protein n=1 Tax=Kribbella aluminosa TaxID=416017 RepID=A0ABS4V171_9ACTN|nr:hypothetical protein [Kribbella aluminosa]MBP2357563.1 hypothetical protein [Kribbella aluminosa]